MDRFSYAAEAIPAMAIAASQAKHNQPIYQRMLEALRHAPKFFLPDDGKALPVEDGTYLAYSDMLPDNWRLPFPAIVLEFQNTGDNREMFGNALVAYCPKRICVAWEEANGFACAWSISWWKDRNIWLPSLCGTTWLRNPTRLRYLGDVSLINQYIQAAARAGMPDPEKALYAENASDCLSVPILCAALACKNVSTQFVPPPERLNRRRIARGKIPFDGYHVLVLSSKAKADDAALGTHSSPREHLRRGHIRRLDSGNIWINATVVNPGVGARVSKDYRVRAFA